MVVLMPWTWQRDRCFRDVEPYIFVTERPGKKNSKAWPSSSCKFLSWNRQIKSEPIQKRVSVKRSYGYM